VKPDVVANLSQEYERYWHRELVHLPSHWVPALIGLWEELDAINIAVPLSSEHRVTWVSLRYQIFPADMSAYATPTAHIGRWTPAHAFALIVALDKFHRRVRETCEECGSRSGYRQKTQLGIGGHDQILCDACGERKSSD
jgi:hypothetical protein